MKCWNVYTTLVNRNCSSPGNAKDLNYWRDNLFAGTIIYLLPFCLIALIPGLVLSFINNMVLLVVVDFLAIAGMLLVAFKAGISIRSRKIIFISGLYTISFAMLHYLGLSGPGLMYMLANCTFCILLFPTSYKFWPAWLNAFICLLIAIAFTGKL